MYIYVYGICIHMYIYIDIVEVLYMINMYVCICKYKKFWQKHLRAFTRTFQHKLTFTQMLLNILKLDIVITSA